MNHRMVREERWAFFPWMLPDGALAFTTLGPSQSDNGWGFSLCRRNWLALRSAVCEQGT